MKNIYKINPQIVFSTKDGVTKIVSMDDSNQEIISLKGPVADCLKLFDGKSELEQIKAKLDSALQKKGNEADFKKFVDFLVSKNLIIEN